MKKEPKKVDVITIGDELLIGQVVDTNSAWLGAELNLFGFELQQISSVRDQEKAILEALRVALAHSDIVLITGGVGPTKDDITKNTLCKFFETDLVFDKSVFTHIEELFKNRPNVMNELTRSQAMVPRSSTVLPNEVGTAPILLFEKAGKVVVAMPGVPFEMKLAMQKYVLPYLRNRFDTPNIHHKTIQVYGYPESLLALKLAAWESNLPENIHLAYLPNYGIVRLRLSGVGEDAPTLELALNQQLELLRKILSHAILSEEDVPLEELLGRSLKKMGKTISTAESCTGGNIARLITSVPSSSEYFRGSVVAYANDVKVNLLGVSQESIEQEGVVSSFVVEQMAKGAMRLLKTDFALATSGIAGPTGGTSEKPVGTVWIAACSKDKMISRRFFFQYERKQNIERTTQAALLMLRELF